MIEKPAYLTRRAAISTAAALLATALGLLPGISNAKTDYPAKPITIIVPFAPGGVTDGITRALAQAMSQQLNQPVVVENKSGSGGIMGVLDMKNAKPDGYRLTLVPSSVLRLPHIQKVSYDPIEDLTYISTFTAYDFIIGVAADSPIENLNDLLEQARKEPGSINYGTPGRFTANQIVMNKLGKEAGVELVHVPFKGDADATTALLGGHIKTICSTNTILNFIQGGKVRALAVAAEERLPAFADVPTLKESGYDLAFNTPLGIAGPKGMPADIVQKIDKAVKAALQDPQMKQSLQSYGMRADYRDHTAFTDWTRKTYAAEKTLVEGLDLDD